MKPVGVEFRQIDKRFGSCHPSRGLSFAVTPGKIHGLIGENGAGKSTAMKLLFGLIAPDSGQILIDGAPVSFDSPNDAVQAGLGMVHQHFMLAAPMSALDNFLLARPGGPFQWLSRKKLKRQAQELAQSLGFEIPWDKSVESLSVGEQQRLEILKVLAEKPRLLILDEPTAVLSPPEIKEFLQRLRTLRDEGRTIILISHKLHEIMQVCDEVTVLRTGRVAASLPISEASATKLAELMIGRRETDWVTSPAPNISDEKLRISDLSAERQDGKKLEGVSLSIRGGEIVGIAGVEGNGQDLLLDLLSSPGLFNGDVAGSVEMLKQDSLKQSNRTLRERGIAFFPEDRLRFGVMESRSGVENYLLGKQTDPDLRHGPWLKPHDARANAQKMMHEFQVSPPDPDLALGSLSGGNQQKFVVGRELSGKPALLIAAHPTRGVDLGAVRMIHDRLIEARDNGAAILLVSSELEELMRLCDRVHVFFRGRSIACFQRGSYNEVNFGLAMGGKEFP